MQSDLKQAESARFRTGETSAAWGVAPGPAVWPTVLRILFVIDGRIDTSTCPTSFGLGYVLETLRDPSFAWWVRFKVQVVRRDVQPMMAGCLDNPDTNYNHPGEPPPNFEIFGFRFTQEGFNFDDWDQIWFFGDYPGNTPWHTPDPSPDDPRFSPLMGDELRLLAEWMDRGGGVFAAGDHWDLGASMCSRIPRVRTMRKWTLVEGVPTMDGDRRNQTLQGDSGNPDALEGDTTPQPIELVYSSRAASILARPLMSHPLLSTTTGVIDHFPDHMHEGEVVEDDAVELDRPLGIPGYEGVEYPAEEPEATFAVAAGASGIEPVRPRPRPHVVAYGRTTNLKNVLTPPIVLGDHATVGLPGGGPSIGESTVRFGLVGAYDGDRVGIGRVVVDSTWHHWFSFNLHGFAQEQGNPAQYALMQAYYRNVGLWLAGLEQRQSMLVAAVWGTVVTDPMAFPAAPSRTVWAVGKRAVEVMARTVSQPLLFDFVASLFSGKADEIFGVPTHVQPADPYAEVVPADLAVRAVVGGIASSLIRPAFDYLEAEGKPRRLLDPEAITRHAAEGFKQGQLALVAAVQSSAAASKRIVSRLEDAFRPSPQGPLPVDLVALRVVSERLQFPDPTDPALADGRITITARAAIAGSVSTFDVIKEIELPSSEPAGAFIDLERVLYEGVVQTGESLVIELVTGEAAREQVSSERVRFSDTLDGDPMHWAGAHAPARSQHWRLWYRIETGAAAGEASS
jgi:hypothetical protein